MGDKLQAIDDIQLFWFIIYISNSKIIFDEFKFEFQNYMTENLTIQIWIPKLYDRKSDNFFATK